MPRRTFLPSGRPLLTAVADHLCSGWTGDALDLSDLVAVVPTAGAGRLLREELALRTAARGAAVLSPHIITPEIITAWALREKPAVATAADMLFIWMQVLTETPPDSLPGLFPVPPPSQDASWARSTASEFLRLRRTLEEGGRTITAAAGIFAPPHPDSARWQDLAALEALAARALERCSLTDPTAARLAAAAQPVFPPGVKRLMVLAVPDPPKLFLDAAAAAERQGLPVEVCVHASPDAAAAFDAWGRPLPDVWTASTIDIPSPDSNIRLVARPADAAALISENLTSGPDDFAFGSADAEVASPLRELAAAAGVTVFDPSGEPLRSHLLSWVLTCLADLLRSDSAAAAGRLLRVPAIAESFGAGSVESLLREWDEFCQAHLPRTLTDATVLVRRWKPRRRNFPSEWKSVLHLILDALRDACEELRRPRTRAADLFSFIDRCTARWSFTSEDDRRLFTDALEIWQDALESIDVAASCTGYPLDAAAALETALHLLREARLYSDNRDGAPVLNGWLEMPWQPASRLFIAGLNEGMVPDSMAGDPWLPDSVRARLDLSTNASRLARDSCLLQSMISSRESGGNVMLAACRESSAGDPLKPGRLLLRCREEELPDRALRLFPRENMEDERPSPPAWYRAWKLEVPAPDTRAEVFSKLSVTQFIDYLSCPFRFYLKHVLRMEPFDAARDELDARGFGSLIHDSIQKLHESDELRDSADAPAITDFLDETICRLTDINFGEDPGLPVTIQLESARSRLRAFAAIHAEERARGWRIEHVEQSFPEALDGVEISGRIDLIERHAGSGRRRVIDYKTGAKGTDPAKAHLRVLRGKAGSLPAWQTVAVGGKVHAWTNLQLPFYVWIVRRLGHEDVEAGYITLPLAASEAGVLIWNELDEELMESAIDCARGVIHSIREGRFWPPAKVEYDDFKDLWFRDIIESFDPSQLEAFRKLRAEPGGQRRR